MTSKRNLSAREANRLAVQMQYLRVKLVEFTLRFSFNGKSVLWGQQVDENTLAREKAILAELYRLRGVYESKKYNELPYLNCGRSEVKKIKEHYSKKDGTIAFLEVKESSHGKSVSNHLSNKKTVKRRLKKKQSSLNKKLKTMATKKRVLSSPNEDDLLGFINTSEIDNMLDKVAIEIPPYKIGDKIEFVFAGGKVKANVHKVLADGKLKATDKAGTLYTVDLSDILKEGETAKQLIARKNGKRPVYIQTEMKIGNAHPTVKPEKSNKPIQKKEVVKAKPVAVPVKKKEGGKSQRELVETLLEKGERDYDKIAYKTGVTRVNVGQYAYRWKKANPKKW